MAGQLFEDSYNGNKVDHIKDEIGISVENSTVSDHKYILSSYESTHDISNGLDGFGCAILAGLLVIALGAVLIVSLIVLMIYLIWKYLIKGTIILQRS